MELMKARKDMVSFRLEMLLQSDLLERDVSRIQKSFVSFYRPQITGYRLRGWGLVVLRSKLGLDLRLGILLELLFLVLIKPIQPSR